MGDIDGGQRSTNEQREKRGGPDDIGEDPLEQERDGAVWRREHVAYEREVVGSDRKHRRVQVRAVPLQVRHRPQLLLLLFVQTLQPRADIARRRRNETTRQVPARNSTAQPSVRMYAWESDRPSFELKKRLGSSPHSLRVLCRIALVELLEQTCLDLAGSDGYVLERLYDDA